jgi:hypothetical protein
MARRNDANAETHRSTPPPLFGQLFGAMTIIFLLNDLGDFPIDDDQGGFTRSACAMVTQCDGGKSAGCPPQSSSIRQEGRTEVEEV